MVEVCSSKVVAVEVFSSKVVSVEVCSSGKVVAVAVEVCSSKVSGGVVVEPRSVRVNSRRPTTILQHSSLQFAGVVTNNGVEGGKQFRGGLIRQGPPAARRLPVSRRLWPLDSFLPLTSGSGYGQVEGRPPCSGGQGGEVVSNAFKNQPFKRR